MLIARVLTYKSTLRFACGRAPCICLPGISLPILRAGLPLYLAPAPRGGSTPSIHAYECVLFYGSTLRAVFAERDADLPDSFSQGRVQLAQFDTGREHHRIVS